MREIKFRGRCLDNGEWVYGSLLVWEDKDCSILYHKDGDLFFEMTKVQVEPATVGQYTGMKDKNGKEIYEGDIISGGRTFHVIWDMRGACWTGEMHKDPERLLDLGFLITSKYIRIIGNIHDNPELLKGV